MFKLFCSSLFLSLIFFANLYGNDNFDQWVKKFKIKAINSGISKGVVDDVWKAKFLQKWLNMIEPLELWGYIYLYKKRTSKRKIKDGLKLYKNEKVIKKNWAEFDVKRITIIIDGNRNKFRKIFGKMDIISSLATLSYDKRRSDFFIKELLIVLSLVDKNIINKDILWFMGSAFGNFQFGTIRNYAIDYNKNNTIELKNIEDSFASAANYLKTIGWKKNQPCFIKIKLKENIPKKYLNASARNIKNKRKVKFFSKYILNFSDLNIKENFTAAIITPDKDIIPGSDTLSPAYLVFDNYEKILNWNRSLRFALAVCTLKESFKNEI